MNAHQLDADGVIINTIAVESLDVFPDMNLVYATEGSIGWKYANGKFSPPEVDAIAEAERARLASVPQAVTMRQARLALLGAGLLPSVNAAINAMPSPQKEAANIEWEYSQVVERHRGLVLALGTALGLDALALDNLFIAASKL